MSTEELHSYAYTKFWVDHVKLTTGSFDELVYDSITLFQNQPLQWWNNLRQMAHNTEGNRDNIKAAYYAVRDHNKYAREEMINIIKRTKAQPVQPVQQIQSIASSELVTIKTILENAQKEASNITNENQREKISALLNQGLQKLTRSNMGGDRDASSNDGTRKQEHLRASAASAASAAEQQQRMQHEQQQRSAASVNTANQIIGTVLQATINAANIPPGAAKTAVRAVASGAAAAASGVASVAASLLNLAVGVKQPVGTNTTAEASAPPFNQMDTQPTTTPTTPLPFDTTANAAFLNTQVQTNIQKQRDTKAQKAINDEIQKLTKQINERFTNPTRQPTVDEISNVHQFTNFIKLLNGIDIHEDSVNTQIIDELVSNLRLLVLLPPDIQDNYIPFFSAKIDTVLKTNRTGTIRGGYSISKWDMYANQNLNGGGDDDEHDNASSRATMETLKIGNTDASQKTSGTTSKTASETLQKLTKELEEIQARLKKLNNPLL